MKQSMSVLTSQETEERYTPPWVIWLVKKSMGNIDLDPASCEAAQEIVQAKKYYSAEDDGLKQTWHGRVFLNQPYNGAASKWSKKLTDEYDQGFTKQAIMLCFGKLGYNWFNDVVDYKGSTVLICRERIAFIDAATMLPIVDKNGKVSTAKHCSAFVYFGTSTHRFLSTFKDLGWTLK